MSACIFYHECWYTQSWVQIYVEICFSAHTQMWGPIHSKGKKSPFDSPHWPQINPNEYNFLDSVVEQKKVCDEIKIYQNAKSAKCHFFCTIDSNNHHQYEFVWKFKVRPITGHELNWNHPTSKIHIQRWLYMKNWNIYVGKKSKTAKRACSLSREFRVAVQILSRHSIFLASSMTQPCIPSVLAQWSYYKFGWDQ